MLINCILRRPKRSCWTSRRTSRRTNRTVEWARLLWWLGSWDQPLPCLAPLHTHSIPFPILQSTESTEYLQNLYTFSIQRSMRPWIWCSEDLSSLTMSSACDCHLFYHVGGRSDKWAWLLVGRYESLIRSISSPQPYPENSFCRAMQLPKFPNARSDSLTFWTFAMTTSMGNVWRWPFMPLLVFSDPSCLVTTGPDE